MHRSTSKGHYTRILLNQDEKEMERKVDSSFNPEQANLPNVC